MLLRAFLTHSFTYRLSWPILTLHSHGFLLTFLGFPNPKTIFPLGFIGFPSTPYSLTSSLWACLDPFLLSYYPWVYYFFLWTPLGSFASFETHLSFYGLMIHYSCPSGLMIFSLCSLTLFCPYCLASSCYWDFPKWASTTCKWQTTIIIYHIR